MKLSLLVISVSVVAAASAEQVSVRYLDLPLDRSQPQSLAADRAGNLCIVSKVTEPSGRPQIRILKTDSQGKTLASLDFGGSQGDAVCGVAVDPQGNLVIVGTTTSSDFPLVSPLISHTSPSAAFITKIDSQLQGLLFSTKLGGTQGGSVGTSAGALALDSAGDIYITGGTDDTDFPITPGAFQSQPPQDELYGSTMYAFVTEIGADGKKIIWSTYFGDSDFDCVGGSSCFNAHASTNGSALAVDTEGAVVVSGTTTSDMLPITTGANEEPCECTADLPAGFVAKFVPGGSKLIWGTYLPTSSSGPSFSEIAVNAMALDSTGNVIIGGFLDGALIPITGGALQPALPQAGGFLTKLDAASSRILFSTYFGGGLIHGVSGVVLDSEGAIWITGNSAPVDLPVPQGTPLLGPTYLAGLSPDGSAITSIFTAPAGAAGQAIATTGTNVIALGVSGSLLIASSSRGPSLVGVGNSAASGVSNAVAPYEVISLYGAGIGPASPLLSQAPGGVLPTSLGGVGVLFDGVPAPLLYAGPTQINAIVPSEVMGQDTTTLQILTPSEAIAGPTLLIRPSQPGVYSSGAIDPATSLPYAAALNQDGSVNSASNPAALGSIVTIWATGGGTTFPRPDGTIANGAGGGFALPVSVLGSSAGAEGMSLEVLYAGDAPGMELEFPR